MLQEDVGTCVGLGFPDTGRPISPDLQDAKWLSLVANNSRPSRFREVPSFNIAGAQNLVSTHGLASRFARKKQLFGFGIQSQRWNSISSTAKAQLLV